MTIISHTHQFIYIKARKVASSSLLVALGQHCRDPDIVTAPGDTEGLDNPARNSAGIRTHTAPQAIKRLVTASQWQTYTKISCVRNPWDVAVSMLLWRIHRASQGRNRLDAHYSQRFLQSIRNHEIDTADREYQKHFDLVCRDLNRNCDFYFGDDDSPTCDVYLKYENLQADFDALCLRLGLPRSTLPNLKAQARQAHWHYRDFYDEALCAQVARIAARTIDYFGYRF